MLFSQVVAARNAGHHRPFAALVVLLVIAALIGAAVYIAMRLASRRSGGAGAGDLTPARRFDAAVEQARLRYARGELSRDDFTRVVSDLGGDPPSS